MSATFEYAVSFTHQLSHMLFKPSDLTSDVN